MHIDMSKPASQTAQTRTLGIIALSIVNGRTCTIVYAKPSGVLNVRAIEPTAIETCQNGNRIVRARDPHAEGAWKSFSVSGIMGAAHGDVSGTATITL